MKKPEWELEVVPVLPMTVTGACWPKVTVWAAVPLTVVISIAYWTCAAWSGVSTLCVSTFGICSVPPPCCQYLMMWAWWYMPLLAIVASIGVCSLTVSGAMPRAMPTSPMKCFSPDPPWLYGARFTPNCPAMVAILVVPTRCARSLNPVFEDWASASCTLSP